MHNLENPGFAILFCLCHSKIKKVFMSTNINYTMATPPPSCSNPKCPSSEISDKHSRLIKKFSVQQDKLAKLQIKFNELQYQSKKNSENFDKCLAKLNLQSKGLLENLETQQKTLKQKEIDFQKTVENARIEYKETLKKNEELTTSIGSLEKRAKQAEEDYITLDNKYNELKKIFKSLSNNYDQLKRDQQELQTKHKKSQEDNSKLQKENQELQCIIDNSIENKIKRYYNKIIDCLHALISKIHLFILQVFHSISNYCVFRKSH
jgi:chromosome segregation ATPase